jgi:hypothetical protein
VSTTTRTQPSELHCKDLTGATWGDVTGQLPLFPAQWFECGRCSAEVHIDSTPMPGEACWSCAELIDEERQR